MKRKLSVQAKALERANFFKFKKTGDAINAFTKVCKLEYEDDGQPDRLAAVDGAIYAGNFVYNLSLVSDRLLTIASKNPEYDSENLINLVNRLGEFKGATRAECKDIFALCGMSKCRAFRLLELLEASSIGVDPNGRGPILVAFGNNDAKLLGLSFPCMVICNILDL